jgi:hypothetical protein
MKEVEKIDIGDSVHHNPSNENWIVARIDYNSNELMWMGWPCGYAKISDCILIKKATKEKRITYIKEMANSSNKSDPRISNAIYLIEKENII